MKEAYLERLAKVSREPHFPHCQNPGSELAPFLHKAQEATWGRRQGQVQPAFPGSLKKRNLMWPQRGSLLPPERSLPWGGQGLTVVGLCPHRLQEHQNIISLSSQTLPPVNSVPEIGCPKMSQEIRKETWTVWVRGFLPHRAMLMDGVLLHVPSSEEWEDRAQHIPPSRSTGRQCSCWLVFRLCMLFSAQQLR